MLTEAEVQRTFRKMVSSSDGVGPDVLDKAEALLDELRPESPLRHRLGCEIDELRALNSAQKN